MTTSVSQQTRRQAPRQSAPIGLVRAVLRHWPLPRGKGIVLRLSRPLLQGEVVIDVEPGLAIPVDLTDYMARWFFIGDLEQDPTFRFLHRLIGPGDTVFDIGANIGLWTLGAARRAGAANTHAFEPVPENFERLVAGLALNGLDEVHCQLLALSDRAGRTSFFANSVSNSGGAALARREGVDREIQVDLTTLDEYCTRSSIARVDVMKVDVEGAEPLVFRGGAKLLGSPDAPMIQFEISGSLLASFDSSPTALKALLASFGYDLFRYDGRSLQPISIEEPHGHEDLIALKPAHFERYSLLRDLSKRRLPFP